MASTVSWTTFAVPNTLFNVGPEAIGIVCDNILCFTDLKTKAISYYKAESPELGLSIQAATGHNKFCLAAFCEYVLRPSVHVIQYPELTKYAVFKAKNIITFADIRFNEYDLLIALSGYPHYTFCIWNFRTGQLLVQHNTFKASLANSILCSFHHTPQIVQFSEWNSEILVWELCYTAAGVDMHETSKVELPQEFMYSNISSMCYSDDNQLYVVDNLANVFVLEVAEFHLKPQWSAPDAEEVGQDLKCFCMESHKQGLLVYRQDLVYYLRRKQTKWHCEWKLLSSALPIGIGKCLSNGGGEIYVAAAEGNLYHADVANEIVQVRPIHEHKHENSIDFVILNGTREECLLLLTTTSCVKALPLSRYIPYSSIEIPEANSIGAHNTAPYILVGTSTGKIHLLNYSNIREPVIINSLECKKPHAIRSLQFLDKMAAYSTIYNEFHWIRADMEANLMHEVVIFESFKSEAVIKQCFLAENSFFIFFSRDSTILLPHAKLMNCYKFYVEHSKYERLEFELPFDYRDVAMLMAAKKSVIEFYAVRLYTTIMDYLTFNMDTNELEIVHSIQTKHLAHISGITGSMNLLTWGVDGTFIHYRMPRMAPRPYGASQMLQIKYKPRVVQKVLECFAAKYLVYMYSKGGIKVMLTSPAGLPPSIENRFIDESLLIISRQSISTHPIDRRQSQLSVQHSPEELQARDKLLEEVRALGKELTELINYDISVTGKSQGLYKKFCLHHQWLKKVNEEAEKLYQLQRESMLAAIKEEARIRDWIYDLVTKSNTGISYKLRGIFSHFSVENYCLSKRSEFNRLYDLYRFYDMETIETDNGLDEENEPAKVQEEAKQITYFGVKGPVYDHVMSDELAMQDVDLVTGNQMYNQDVKVRILLIDPLKREFNKKFDEVRQTKFDLMAAISGTNDTLTKIYSDMNCMLKLLGRDEFEHPQLTVPEWQKDESVKSIMEVDDSEIKAVNRRKKKDEVLIEKPGRLLLWSADFWPNALNSMMDGVLEKLWEEEIKKDIPKPEFLNKKDVAEYTLEDQKALKDYEEKCRTLEEDREKYLSILKENEVKTNQLKKSHILELNENVAQLMMTKLKYDFAVEHVRLRNINTKIMYFKKLKWLDKINLLRTDIDSITEYIQKYGTLHTFWSKSVDDFRLKADNLMQKEKTIERQFRSQFLNSIPQHLGPEMNKIFKKRPKVSPKLLNSNLICKELAMRVNSKAQPKYAFPLPKDVFEYLDGLTSLDDTSNTPVSLESKYWEQFVKLRRQKVEIELKIRAVNSQLADAASDMNSFGKDLANLNNSKVETNKKLEEAQEEYLKSVQDQSVVLNLTMGQIEVDIMGCLGNFENCLLIHQDDINDLNASILNAGQKKINAMKSLAKFRRQIIYKEWEHKMVFANVEYLKEQLHVIEKFKVTKEFLDIVRNWDKVKADRQKYLNTEGLLEKAKEDKLAGPRRELQRLKEQKSQMLKKVEEIKRSNRRIDREIEQMKICVTHAQSNRDVLLEEKIKRERNERMEKIRYRSNLAETIRQDYVRIMELKTILELQRLRTYPTLGPGPSNA